MTNLRLHPQPSWQNVTIRESIVSLPHDFLTRRPAPSSWKPCVCRSASSVLPVVWSVNRGATPAGAWYANLSPPGDRDGRHAPGEDPYLAVYLVRSRLAGDHDQEWLCRQKPRTDPRYMVSRGLESVATLSGRDGARRTHAPVGYRRRG